MEWYRFTNDDPVGIFRVKKYQVAFYDENGCYDESWYKPYELAKIICFSRSPEETEGSRLYAHFDNGEQYEIFAKKVED